MVIDATRKEHESDGSVVVLVIYCTWNVQYTALQLLESLLKQQLLACPTEALLKAAQQYRQQGRRFSHGEIRKLLRTEASSLKRQFIFLDGFDELFPQEEREILLPHFHSLLESSLTSRIMIVSRPLPTIANLIFSKSVPIRAYTFDVEADASDLKFHIEKEIMQSSSLYNIITEPPSMLEHVVNTIQQKSEGLYVTHRCYLPSHADIVLASSFASSIYFFFVLIPIGYP
jgi:uncharacterized protein involved in tolerance to divalent cations